MFKAIILMRSSLRYFTFFIWLAISLFDFTNSGSSSAQTPPKTSSAQQPKTLIFVVTGEGRPEMTLDAVAVLENGKIKPPYAEESEPQQQRFAGEFFKAGTKYRLTFGGGEVGTVTVRNWNKGCNNIHANVDVETRTKIHGQVMALATNSETLARKESRRRAPTEAERTAVMELVKQIYRSRRTPMNLVRRLRTTNLTATDLNGDGNYEMIGSFVIETPAKLRRDLFLIAESTGAGFKSALIEYQNYKLPPEGFDSAISFVDQLDLDGDGIGEVFVSQHGFDAYGYSIYQKQAGRWRRVLTMVGDAC